MNKNQSSIQLLNNINKNFINNKKIKKKQKILISISGGQDSICLFFIFIHLKKQWKWSLGIIYCNHLWQQNSFYSGSLILKTAYLFKIPSYYTISSNKIFKEKNSRYWRYDFFYRLSFFYQYKIINIGHNLNDKIETSLFQNIRGSTLQSLLNLHNLKYFYVNNKFTQNTKIKYTKFYSIYFLITNNIQKYKCIKWDFVQGKQNLFSQVWMYKVNPNKFFLHQPFFILYKANNYFKYKTFHTKKNFYKNYLNIQNFLFLVIKTQRIHTKSILICKKKQKIQKKSFKNFSSPLFFVARPILLLSRFDLKKLLLFFKLPLYPDISNQKKIYYRNKIRKQLIPTLKFFFNPQIEKSFFQFEEIKIEDQFQLNLLFKRLIVELLNSKNFQLNISFLLNLPLSIQRKVINQFVKSITITQTQFINIQSIINFFEKSNSYKFNLSKKYFFSNACRILIKNFNQKKLYEMKFWFLNIFKNFYFFKIHKKYKKNLIHKQKTQILLSYTAKIWHINYTARCIQNNNLFFSNIIHKFQTKKKKKNSKFI